MLIIPEFQKKAYERQEKMAKKEIIRNAGKRRGAKKGHPPAKTVFKRGYDSKRNIHGQKKKKTVELSALLKDYLTEEGNTESLGKLGDKEVRMKNAQWLAKVIWREAIKGEYQFVQYLCDRIMGKAVQPVDGSFAIDGKLIVEVVKTK